MIEILLILLMLAGAGWLLMAAIGVLFSVFAWLVCGLASLIGGLLLMLLDVPLLVLLALVVLPLTGLALLPLAAPLLLGGLLLWWMLRPQRDRVA